jgi:hypothetical protein
METFYWRQVPQMQTDRCLRAFQLRVTSFPLWLFLFDHKSGPGAPGLAYPLPFAAIFNFPSVIRTKPSVSALSIESQKES